MGDFLNEFAVNMSVLPALIVFAALGLPTFGYFYNRLIDKLGDHEHISLYVAIGNFVTILVGSLFSWKAGLLFLGLFLLDGLPMIAGEYRRTHRKSVEKTLRRKRLPYAANARIEDAYDALREAQRLVGVAMKHNGRNVEAALPLAEASSQINLALSRLVELKGIQSG